MLKDIMNNPYVRKLIQHRMLLAFILIVFPLMVWFLSPAIKVFLQLMFIIGIGLFIFEFFTIYGINIMTSIIAGITLLIGYGIYKFTDGFTLATAKISEATANTYAVFVALIILVIALLIRE